MRRTRFAPAPTGPLHLGHVVNAIHVWGLAARTGAQVLLRVEDHDRERSRAEFETGLLDDLDWLGFAADLHPTRDFRSGRCESRQSDRAALHEAAAASLIERGLVYGCTCSRQTIAKTQKAMGRASNAYPGTCRARGLPPGPGLTWRVRAEPGVETFDDLLHGPQVQDPASLHGDPAIRDRRGNWTYMFAVVVDDLLQGIDLVVRGDDLLDATAVQIRLARLMGRQAPARFGHHALLMRTRTQKLSKADGATGIVELRRAGWSPARVIGHAAALAGLAQRGAEIDATHVATLCAAAQLASGSGRNVLPVHR